MAEYISRQAAIEAIDESLKRVFVLPVGKSIMDKIPDADVVPASVFRDCRNELCLKCGAYTQKHLGACDGCRWRGMNG